MLNQLSLPYHILGHSVHRLKREDLDEITDWPKFDFPYAWANFNITDPKLKDKWIVRNTRADTLWFIMRSEKKIVARGSIIQPEEGEELIFGMVLKPDIVDHGIGTKCVRMSMQMIFDQTTCDRVWLETKENNTRARKTWEKVGFILQGVHYRRDVYGVYSKYVGYRLYRTGFISDQG